MVVRLWQPLGLRPSAARAARYGQCRAGGTAALSHPLESRILFSTFTVDTLTDDSTSDDRLLSLREAVEQANTKVGDDTILFAPQLQGTVSLAGAPLVVGDTGGSLTVRGPGPAALLISGDDSTGVFEIDTGASATISGLTITGGKADTGGGISSVNATVTLLQCALVGNRAGGPTGRGGGIYTKGGVLTVADCTFSSNAAEQMGGGIFIEGATWPETTTVSVTRSSFVSNAAPNGGGIAVPEYASLSLTDTAFYANRASVRGGAIFGGASITACAFIGNTAEISGGGVWQFFYGQALNIADSTFLQNKAGRAGAVGVHDAAQSTIANCTFRDNRGTAVTYGLTTVTITGSVFDSNQGPAGGALLGSEAHFNIRDTRFVNNVANAGDGGAVVFVRCAATFDNDTFTGNQAIGGNGGAITFGPGYPTLAISNSRFKNNAAVGLNGTSPSDGGTGGDGGSAEGGALFFDIESIQPRITGSTFTGNSARGGNGGAGGAGGIGGTGGDAAGGAISNRAIGFPVVLAGCTLTNNNAIGGKGGDAGSAGVAGNGGNALGGALFGFTFGSRSGSLSDSTITGNVAAGGNGGNAPAGGVGGDGGSGLGGGFSATYGAPGNMMRCLLTDNVARGGNGGRTASRATAGGSGGNGLGGGFFAPPVEPWVTDPAAFTISASNITRNRAIGGGGATAGLGIGGGIYSAGQTVYVDSTSRVTGNRASNGFDDVFGNDLAGN